MTRSKRVTSLDALPSCHRAAINPSHNEGIGADERCTADVRASQLVHAVIGSIVTAPGDGPYNFVSRYFAPAKGIPEDPVTGSAH
jgi:predicted PhzF superfamily epimerase YddE/YHI9